LLRRRRVLSVDCGFAALSACYLHSLARYCMSVDCGALYGRRHRNSRLQIVDEANAKHAGGVP